MRKVNMRRAVFGQLAKLAVLGISVLAFWSATVDASPTFGGVYQLKDPDGSLVKVRIWGDEFYQVVESMDGYTLVRDPRTNIICYAKLSKDGNDLLSTGVKVNSRSRVPDGIEKHIRINPAAADIKISRSRDKFYSLARAANTRGRFDIKKVSGTIKGICILVQFPDELGTTPYTDIENYCNKQGYSTNGNNGSIRDFFYDVSSGKLVYTNYVTPKYYTAQHNKSYYDNGGDAGTSAKALILEMLNALEADGFDFSQYDSDNDGKIDAINLLYAGECQSGWAKGLWPHCMPIGWDYFEADGVKSDCYQITPMIGQTGDSLTIGTFCHENGHMLCKFPDLYCYEQSNPSRGVGKLCLMCEGGHGVNPVWPSAYLRYRTGWAAATELDSSTSQSYTIQAFSNKIFRYANPSDSKEYFLLENRQQSGRDASLPTSGMAIYLVDEDGSNEYPTSTQYAGHNEVSVMQADGKKDLENGVNTSDTTDLWSTKTQTSFGSGSNPASKWWTGTSSGLSVTNISSSAETMTFDVGGGGTATTPSIGVDTTSFTVKCTVGSNASSEEFSIWNKGKNTLSYTIASDASWLSCSSSTGSSTGTTDKKTITISFSTSSLAEGTYTGKITITDTNADNSPVTLTVALTVSSSGGTSSSIKLTAPTGGETWYIGKTQQITWTSTNVSQVVVQVYKGGELYAQTPELSNTGSFDWTITSDFDEGSDYQVLVYNYDNSSVSDYGGYFTIASSGGSTASITLISPNGGEVWKHGETRTITWTSSGFSGTVSVEVYKGSYLMAYGYQLDDTGEANWTIDDSEGGSQYVVYVYSDDDPYNVYDSNDSYFTVEGGSGGAAGSFFVSIGYEFDIDSDDVPDLQGDASSFDKKPKVYLEGGSGKALQAKVITTSYPTDTITCAWMKKCPAGQYTLYCVPKGYDENTVSEDFYVQDPSIDVSSSTWSGANPKVTSKGTFYDITLSLVGQYFGLKKPKVVYMYTDPVKGSTKKKSFKVTTYGNDNIATGDCSLTAIGKKIPYGATGTVYLTNQIGESTVSLDIVDSDSSSAMSGTFKKADGVSQKLIKNKASLLGLMRGKTIVEAKPALRFKKK